MAIINCPECGNSISDKARSCPNCGCPTSNPAQASTQNRYAHYPELKPYCDQVKLSLWMAVAALILVNGIGFVLAIINVFRLHNIQIPSLTLTNPIEIAEFESAKRRHNTAKLITNIALVIGCILLFIMLILFLTSNQF